MSTTVAAVPGRLTWFYMVVTVITVML